MSSLLTSGWPPWPPYGPEQNRFHTRISKDCFNQPFRFTSKLSLLFACHWYRIGFKLNLGFCETYLGGLTVETNCFKYFRAKQTAPQLWIFPPADPNSLYGRVLCVHAHIQGPKSRQIAIMHSKGAFSQSRMLWYYVVSMRSKN